MIFHTKDTYFVPSLSRSAIPSCESMFFGYCDFLEYWERFRERNDLAAAQSIDKLQLIVPLEVGNVRVAVRARRMIAQ